MRGIWIVACLLVTVSAASAQPAPEEVTIPSGALKLRGYLVRPEGKGPFPALVYNHGSGRDFDVAFLAAHAEWWRSQGFVVVYPLRRGTGGSPGVWWREAAGADPQKAVPAIEAENDDVVAAIAWARAQPFIDPRRVAVGGCSFGGIHALLAGQRDSGARAVLDFAGGAMSWEQSPQLRERMRVAARGARVPVFLIQAENDFNVAPSRELDGEMTRARKPHRMTIYPAFGKTPQAGHGGFCVRGMPSWGADARAFLDAAFAAR